MDWSLDPCEWPLVTVELPTIQVSVLSPSRLASRLPSRGYPMGAFAVLKMFGKWLLLANVGIMLWAVLRTFVL